MSGDLLQRRHFNLALLAALGSPLSGCNTARGTAGGGRIVLYDTAGNRLTHYSVDVAAGTLARHETLTLPSEVQYAWVHPTRRYLYACTSDRQKIHRLCAFRIGADGELSALGEPVVLAIRPIHLSVDAAGQYVLTAYSEPASFTVHRIAPDGGIGAEVAQPPGLDTGVFAHQIRTLPGNRAVVLVTRGINALPGKPEEPGGLKVFGFRDGRLTPRANIQPGGRGGLGYGPRHLDFHPTRPWVYLSLERQNLLHMYRLRGDDIAPDPVYVRKTTIGEYPPDVQQIAGAIHVHPRGHVVYVANRAASTINVDGKAVFRGGENNIAVYAIDPRTGEPTLLQHAEVPGYYTRTFTIDPSGRLLVAESTVNMLVRDGTGLRRVPASLLVYRIAADGRLALERQYEVGVSGSEQQLWAGMMALRA